LPEPSGLPREFNIAASISLVLLLTGGACLLLQSPPETFHRDTALKTVLEEITDDYRKIIVLVDGAEALDPAAQARATAAGRILFYRKHQALNELSAKLEQSPDAVRQLIYYLTQDRTLHDADKLAFQDIVNHLIESQPPVTHSGRDGLDASLRLLRDNLQLIQLRYSGEVTCISQFATLGESDVRKSWNAHVAGLRKQFSREQILHGLGDAVAREMPDIGDTRAADGSNELSGKNFAAYTVALTFDDGPHPVYTEQVLAVLRKYGLKACFFELGSHLGKVDANGQVKLAPTAELTRKVLEDGHAIGDHTYSHPMLTRLSDRKRAAEIDRTAKLLETIAGRKPELFRAPYGALNKQILDHVTAEGMRSVSWTIDSMDWADPVPESIVIRVLRRLNKQHRGIILFHDSHKQCAIALSQLIEELLRQNYTFLEYRGGQFVKTSVPLLTKCSTSTSRRQP
jgi:peptidoglycan/xylan/chitin deacetylase (PgdA/CDA1 family)